MTAEDELAGAETAEASASDEGLGGSCETTPSEKAGMASSEATGLEYDSVETGLG